MGAKSVDNTENSKNDESFKTKTVLINDIAEHVIIQLLIRFRRFIYY